MRKHVIAALFRFFYTAKAELVRNGCYYFDKRDVPYSKIRWWVQTDECFAFFYYNSCTETK